MCGQAAGTLPLRQPQRKTGRSASHQRDGFDFFSLNLADAGISGPVTSQVKIFLKLRQAGAL